MNKSKIPAILFLILTVLCCLVIWSFSFDNAESSGAESDRVGEITSEAVEKVSGAKVTFEPFVIRKTAHFVEFAVLGVLLYMTFHYFGIRKIKTNYAIGVSVSFAVAAIDEFLQLFSEGRSAQMGDVLLDVIGSMFAFSICVCIYFLSTMRRIN